MARYRHKPELVDAVQWFKMGDHPDVERCDSPLNCVTCNQPYIKHGWLQDTCCCECGDIICPGDWVVAGNNGEIRVVRDKQFGEIYEEAE